MLQLRTIKAIVNSRVSQRGCFQSQGLRFEMRKALFIGKQRLATGQDCSTVVYILGKAWSKYGKHMACVCK